MNSNVDYLVSLIGTNPMPSFITTLKNCNEKSKIYFVYTESSEINIGTKKVSENLANVLEDKISNIDIQFVKCDKSDTEKIGETATKILQEVKNHIDKDPYKNKRLVLDYSSGTKVMSSIFYDRFKEFKLENCKVVPSYVNDIRGEIIDDKFTKVEEVVKDNNLGIEDITKIHGYKLKNKQSVKELKYETSSGHYIYRLRAQEKVQFGKSSENLIEVDSVIMLKGRIYIYYVSKYPKQDSDKGKLKMELFLLKDMAEKLGGSRSRMIYKSNIKEKNIKALEKDLTRDYDFDMEKRLFILGKGEILEDKLKEWQEIY